ncbi:putative receptor-like protein kinase [Iris pallida]|uniref:Receptor-like protein kinase n=1 Tax=Iris pallida TaxID=29817 RepID=A0AAX6F8L8_IRIPA|nr:putative receptor-like protein kinase [Iris pallida]
MHLLPSQQQHWTTPPTSHPCSRSKPPALAVVVLLPTTSSLRTGPRTSPSAPGSASAAKLRLIKFVLPSVAFVLKAKASSKEEPLCLNYHRRIPYFELARATDNFSEDNLLGRGSIGKVYKGSLDGGLLVAVKVLNLEVEGASRSFDAECRTLGQVRHRNLVKIISTCSNMEFKALVLEFMPNLSLDKWLYSQDQCLNSYSKG